MPVLVAWLVNALRLLFMSRLGLFIATAMTWLGVNWGTMKLVVTPALDMLRDYAANGGMGASGPYVAKAQAWMGVLQFDKVLTMVISAYVIQQTVMKARVWLFKRGT